VFISQDNASSISNILIPWGVRLSREDVAAFGVIGHSREKFEELFRVMSKGAELA
jgi:hypothetical protein